jgi:ribosomal protein L11 methyltransferase
MPYRIDLSDSSTESLNDALEVLASLGALDVETTARGLAALMPDIVQPEDVRYALGLDTLAVSPAMGRDDESVWILSPRPVRIGVLELRLCDGPAFGTGLHPTTAMCLELLDELPLPESVLDLGTGSGVLALAALLKGVHHATGVDIDPASLEVAAENARLNNLEARLRLIRGGAEDVRGSWPLVFANILAAPLIEIAPAVVRLVGHRGQLVLSGIPTSLVADVARVYRHSGMRPIRSVTRGGWEALLLEASW